ncbi:MAG TPA: BON domain-containing protein [Usitatibacter sp.]|nr:BON domain-containing protein [Usitatibacter sp.]
MALVAATIPAMAAAPAPSAAPKDNPFGDPFLEVSNGIRSCPQVKPPAMTDAQMQTESHARVERGTRCYVEGRCRLPNSYQYDREIIPRVRKAVAVDGHFKDTSVWVLGQRRWVFLQGCVRSKAQSQALEKLVRGIDDVERVVNQLAVVSR